jgi:hypothetical protein
MAISPEINRNLKPRRHSIGGGLYVGDDDAAVAANRQAVASAFSSPFPGRTAPRISYDQIRDAETGGILTII